jgi:glycosyltransferase involved in cell wall biosynthesis
MKVTVVVPCYNSMRYLEECLKSVLNQDYDDYVVWAYDNESTDGTYEYLLDLEKKRSRLTVFRLPNIYPNGYGEAQEHVIKNLKTDYVTFVGSDDFLDVDYISKCMKIINHAPKKIKCVQSGLKCVRDGQVTNHQAHSYKSLNEFKKQCLVKSPVNTPTVIWHKSLVHLLRVHEAHDAAGISCIGSGDYDTYCHMADRGIFIYPIPTNMGYNYRWHKDQATWKVHKNKKDINYDQIIQNYWKEKWTL